MTAMTTAITVVPLLLALAAAFALLAAYARRDHFTTPRAPLRDELGVAQVPAWAETLRLSLRGATNPPIASHETQALELPGPAFRG